MDKSKAIEAAYSRTSNAALKHGWNQREAIQAVAVFEQSLLADGFAIVPVEATKVYTCPVCGDHDPNRYTRCNRADCTDGRDPR